MTRRRIALFAVALGGLTGLTGLYFFASSIGQEGPQGPVNLPIATLGGTQFWADIRFREGWRLQHNLVTGHFRLLDEHNVRQAWGTREATQSALDRMAPRPDPAAFRHLVVLIHGALRSPGSFSDLQIRLEDEGYAVAAISYASSRRPLEDHAADLNALIADLEGYDRISFVTHSMGGLVIRVLLAQDAAWRARLPVSRVVQIAPPNQGSIIAERMRDTDLYRVLYGPAGQQMVISTTQSLPNLSVPFGIIAGGTGDEEGHNSLIPGDDDGVVAVAETRADGALDFTIIDALHSFILNDPETADAVVNFLARGRFADLPR